jgi:hypothetical protein
MLDAAARLPRDPGLAATVANAVATLRRLDPVTARLLTGEGPLVLPPEDAPPAPAAILRSLASDLRRAQPSDVEDRRDQAALLAALARASPGDGPSAPTGMQLLERALLVLLLDLSTESDVVRAELAGVLEAAPALMTVDLAAAAGCIPAACQMEVAAGLRLPALLDLTAAGVAGTRTPATLRFRIEAALGEALAAAASTTGVLLRDVLPLAAGRAAPLPDTEAGLGRSLEALEAAAEAGLAAAALRRLDAEAAPAVDDADGPVLDPARVSDAWQAVAAAAAAWCPTPTASIRVEPAPAWLAPLLPPLALAGTGALRTDHVRLLVNPAATMSDGELSGRLRLLHLTELVPALHQRAGGRLARLALPVADGGDGWRWYVRTTYPELAVWRRAEVDVEASWRWALALVAIAVLRGRDDPGQAAAMIAREGGIDLDSARLQTAAVKARPVAALGWAAGVVAVAPADAAQRAALVASLPLPASALA